MIEVTNFWDALCNICIVLLEHLSHESGLSYGELNILIFCVLGPLATSFYFISSLTALFIKNFKKRLYWSIPFITLGTIIVLGVFIFLMYGFLTMDNVSLHE